MKIMTKTEYLPSLIERVMQAGNWQVYNAQVKRLHHDIMTLNLVNSAPIQKLMKNVNAAASFTDIILLPSSAVLHELLDTQLLSEELIDDAYFLLSLINKTYVVPTWEHRTHKIIYQVVIPNEYLVASAYVHKRETFKYMESLAGLLCLLYEGQIFLTPFDTPSNIITDTYQKSALAHNAPSLYQAIESTVPFTSFKQWASFLTAVIENIEVLYHIPEQDRPLLLKKMVSKYAGYAKDNGTYIRILQELDLIKTRNKIKSYPSLDSLLHIEPPVSRFKDTYKNMTWNTWITILQAHINYFENGESIFYPHELIETISSRLFSLFIGADLSVSNTMIFPRSIPTELENTLHVEETTYTSAVYEIQQVLKTFTDFVLTAHTNKSEQTTTVENTLNIQTLHTQIRKIYDIATDSPVSVTNIPLLSNDMLTMLKAEQHEKLYHTLDIPLSFELKPHEFTVLFLCLVGDFPYSLHAQVKQLLTICKSANILLLNIATDPDATYKMQVIPSDKLKRRDLLTSKKLSFFDIFYSFDQYLQDPMFIAALNKALYIDPMITSGEILQKWIEYKVSMMVMTTAQLPEYLDVLPLPRWQEKAAMFSIPPVNIFTLVPDKITTKLMPDKYTHQLYTALTLPIE